MTTYRFTLFVATLSLLLLPATPAPGEVNKAVKGFLPIVRPINGSDKASPGDLGALNKQMISAMNYLGKHHDSYGKDGSDIIELAIQNYGDEMFSSLRASLLRTSLTRTWEQAQALGLFTKGGNFRLIITKGPEKGKNASFEYIVLPKDFPHYSRDLTNLRLVTPATRRARGEERLTTLEKIHAKSLDRIEGEILYGRADALGRTSADNFTLWKRDVGTNEAVLEKQPTFHLTGKITATPSGSNGDKWRVSFEAINISTHPTEVIVTLYIFGITEKKNEIFLLRKTSVPQRLRKNQFFKKELFTGSRSSYADLATRIDQNKPKGYIKPLISSVNMRGWAIEVTHRDKVIAQAASQPMMLDYVERSGVLPGKRN